jgi:hypothetical protein
VVFFVQVSPPNPAAISPIIHVNTWPAHLIPFNLITQSYSVKVIDNAALVKYNEPTDTQRCSTTLQCSSYFLIQAYPGAKNSFVNRCRYLCDSTHRVCMRRLLRDHCPPLVFIIRTGQLEFYPGSPEKAEAIDFTTTTMADLTSLALTLAVVAQGKCQTGRCP